MAGVSPMPFDGFSCAEEKVNGKTHLKGSRVNWNGFFSKIGGFFCHWYHSIRFSFIYLLKIVKVNVKTIFQVAALMKVDWHQRLSISHSFNSSDKNTQFIHQRNYLPMHYTFTVK